VAAYGPKNVRTLERALRDAMTEHAGVVRDEPGILVGRAALDRIESRLRDVGVHPDISSFRDLAHAFDLKSSVLAARATLECALERRETRGCHNRSDYPRLDPALQMNLIWSGPGRIECEPVPPIPPEIAERMVEVSSVGKFVE
jgi:succinate dehydrogenase / fumarate reductase flavoprotein subunit